MNWVTEICNNCKYSSYSLSINKICPHCNPDFIFERILQKIITEQDSDIKAFTIKNCEKYKVSIEEITNRLIAAAAFYKNQEIKKHLVDLIDKLSYKY